LFPLHKESRPILKYHRQKLSQNLTRWSLAPLDIEVEETFRTSKKIYSDVPLPGFISVKMRRKMVTGIE